MPVYNAEQYLSVAIESVLNQTFNDFELILINDGSTDRSQEIIDAYNDTRIVKVVQENSGVAAACQKGLFMARGKYLMRHDADDASLPEKLERQVEFLENHKNIALVGTQIAFMTHRGKIAHDCRQPKNNYFQGQSYRLVSIDDFNPYSPITHATILARTEILKDLGGYRKEFLTSEDTDLWLRLLDNHKAAVMNVCDYFVRMNPASATSRYRKSTNFYRETAIAFARERSETGMDPLMRGEKIMLPHFEILPLSNSDVNKKKGRILRKDLLNYQYKIARNARDIREIIKIVFYSIRDGWRLARTWKALIFPVLGSKLIDMGVKMKRKTA